MKRTLLIILIVLEILIIAGLGWGIYSLHTAPAPTEPTTQPTTVPETTAPPAEVPTTVPETTAEETTLPPDIHYTISLAGDCTLGNFKGDYGSEGSFMDLVGDNYDYPFANVKSIFEADDFTMVNFEGTLTDSRNAVDKTFNFHAPPAYAKILPAGSVEAVNLSNNHSYDYGEQGYQDTMAALDAENIPYTLTNGTLLYTTERGLKIGVYADSFLLHVSDMEEKIAELRDQGAEIVIVCFHWGIEAEYFPTADQQTWARKAIDYGADIVYGHHPHVLQPMEFYEDGIILYSMGNFSFGGNYRPRDMDTVIFQLDVIRRPDGTVEKGDYTVIPCSITSDDYWNNFQPTPYPRGTDGYDRVISKLDVPYQ